MKNLKAFKNLMKKYRSFSVEDLKAAVVVYEEEYDLELTEDSFGFDLMSDLTGFGSKHDCFLCVAVNRNCDDCVWYDKDIADKIDPEEEYVDNYCVKGDHSETYNAIDSAKNEEEVHKAINDRADYMEKWLNLKLKKSNELSEPEV